MSVGMGMGIRPGSRSAWRAGGALATLCSLALLSFASRGAAAELSDRLSAALDARALRGARVAALVVDAQGSTLFERTPDRALIPASNMKVLTSLAALDALGPTHRFTTELLSEQAPNGEGALQTLWVRGSGDPSLTSEDYWRLAADLRRAGVTRVQGDLVLDDAAFDRQRWHPSWGKTGARAYHAPVSALTANYGAFSVTVAPGPASGDPLRAIVDPPLPFLSLVVRGETGTARAGTTLVVDRQANGSGERVIVSGRFPVGRDPKTLHRSVIDPTAYAGAVLRKQLGNLGISVAGETRAGSVPEIATTVLEFDGPPLSDVIWLFMKYSNNQIGESLLKTLGARASGKAGSWQSGAAAVRTRLGALGLPLEGVVVVDGSGLSYENRVTPRLLVAALQSASNNFAFAPEFAAALPIASTDGTLEERAERASGRVRAKTGLLNSVTALSGFALRANGERLTFSILVNGFRGSAEAAMDALDRFAEALASAS